ncbi:hypothetical protein MP228_004620 [Amoeboaphelidium protococcarum]|nr:hypothetical protein MP228_004620 [Amoeboaphelidium protococcarum]
MGWAWTSGLLFGAALLCQRAPVQTRLLGRLLLATLYWYLMTVLVFDNFYKHWNPYALCLTEQNVTVLTDYHSCRRMQHTWNSFDISGHCFILLHSSLVIRQELVLFYGQRNQTGIRSVLIRALLFALRALLALWLFMLIITSTYYHSFAEKFIGALFGVAYSAIMYSS